MVRLSHRLYCNYGGCGAFIQYRLSATEQDVLPDEVVNQARIEISRIMLVLEQHHTEVSSQNRIREELHKWSEEKQLHLQYTGLDGTLLFDSSAPHSMNKDKLNLKSDLHYDLYSSKTAQERFKLAFPVVDPESGVQAGNAIFTLPGSLLAYRQTASFPAMFTLLMIALFLLLLLLFRLRYKINHDLLYPVNGLKDHAEAILKGNYGQKAEYAKQDEIGEVYAVFDQMRSEIMTLSMQNEAQSKARKELISNISHDLKTPLTIVKAYIEAIREGVCSDLPHGDGVYGDYAGASQQDDRAGRGSAGACFKGFRPNFCTSRGALQQGDFRVHPQANGSLYPYGRRGIY